MEKKQEQKKMSIGVIIIVVLAITAFICWYAICSNDLFDQNQKQNSIKKVFLEYATDFEVLNETSEKFQLSITCPDFEKITKQMAMDEIEITSKNLTRAIKNNSDVNKEYVFTVTSLNEEKINEAFLDKVAYDLMINAIQEVEYQESWRLEE